MLACVFDWFIVASRGLFANALRILGYLYVGILVVYLM